MTENISGMKAENILYFCLFHDGLPWTLDIKAMSKLPSRCPAAFWLYQILWYSEPFSTQCWSFDDVSRKSVQKCHIYCFFSWWLMEKLTERNDCSPLLNTNKERNKVRKGTSFMWTIDIIRRTFHIVSVYLFTQIRKGVDIFIYRLPRRCLR